MMEKIDVIILSNTLNDNHYSMTKNTIDTLLKSDGDVEFNIIIIESNTDSNYVYENSLTIKPNEKFNYGKFVNIGYKVCKNDWVLVCNNDLEFTVNWFTEVMKVYSENNEIKSFSFFEPNFHMEHYPTWFNEEDNLYFGYDVPPRLTGWCFLHRRELLDLIGGLDEQFEFYYVDNDYGKMIEYYGIPNCLIKSSVVHHLTGSSHDTIPNLVNNSASIKSRLKFEKKWYNIIGKPFNINTSLKKNKMKITQVTPGLIPVPPNGWGAVEKIIWNYKLNFEKMGHECDVTYLNYVDINSDIIHIHVANLAIEAKQRGIPYIFSLHDHHVVRHGKNSGTYWENLEAIKGSVISFTHAEFLIDYFDETDKLFYLSHGVDTEYFSYTPKEITEHKLLCVANNGYRDNQSYDRKGFRFAIEAAKELGLPITIVGPKNNENFFNVNEDLLDYDRLTILSHNATEEELLQILKEHTIFLHPSELEAGHPNLTILESLSCGIPVVGTYNGSNELKGLKKIDRSTESVVDGILDVMLKYDEYVKNTQQDKLKYDWSVISKRLLKMYESVTLIKKEYSSEITKDLYIDNINSTKKNHISPKEDVRFITHFVNGPFLEIQNNIDKEYYVEFVATNGDIVYATYLKSNMWTRANRQYYEDWTINVYLDNEIVYTEKLNLKGSRVYIAIDSSALGDNLAWVPYIDEFRKKHNCHVICSTFKNDLFESQYPDIEFVNPGSEVKNILAMYMLGWFYDLNKEPTKPNIPSLQEHACNILGLDFTEIRPKLNMDISYRPISEKYITIGPTTTLGCKEWSYPNGWQELVDYLNGLGYKVAVITKEQTPWLNNVLDWTGDHPLQTRINQLYHSEFYIGLGSGLSWLSWSVGKPTVMIANFSKEGHEFTSNCIRITNKSVCNGCWNNPNFTFDKGDWYWCPVNKGTEDQFICQKSITPQMVIEQISHLL
jgi:autotransporter strand-loop-strand O-heptosyltransferase